MISGVGHFTVLCKSNESEVRRIPSFNRIALNRFASIAGIVYDSGLCDKFHKITTLVDNDLLRIYNLKKISKHYLPTTRTTKLLFRKLSGLLDSNQPFLNQLPIASYLKERPVAVRIYM